MSRSTAHSGYHVFQPKFEDVERLENADGLVAIVSQRRQGGELTFAIFREFPGEDGRQRTQFVPESLAKSYQELVTITVDAMAKMRQSGRSSRGPLPFLVTALEPRVR